MKPTQDKYPHFEANQVLTNSHLNQVFDYLDEQERLTRANLIGIGIVCGLNFSTEVNGGIPGIHISRGIGVGSAGYLLNETEDITLVSYREYTLPNELDYPRFKFNDGGVNKQYPLWELFPAGEPNPQFLNNPSAFLNDKVLILFLELKMEGLRNCSPNDCNDKGEEVTASLRHLLIRVTDLEKIVATASAQQGSLTIADLEQSLLDRMKLPDIRLPRWNVPDTSPVSSVDVLEGFHNVFTTYTIADATAKALSAAYRAFSPLIVPEFPDDPFSGFPARFGFLDNTAIPVSDLRFMQYYYGFFEDLLNAYDEFRWKGIELMCACSPPDDLFPRHLMLGAINPETLADPALFRTRFMPSPAIGNCEEQIRELSHLFARLVEMVAKFTNTPIQQQTDEEKKLQLQIRITPDKLADVNLSEKSIPYYYLQSGPRHLFRLWNYEHTKRGRANQNLGYRSGEYTPVAPDFTTKPLQFDLEPYNFLRIEGHLGVNYQAAISRILNIKRQFRLPVDVIALRTGVFDEQNTNVRYNGTCHFNDLEAQYNSRIAELIGFLGNNLRFFYDLFYADAKGLLNSPTVSVVPWFVAWDPDFRVKPTTLGAYLEKRIFDTQLTNPYFDPDNLAINLFQYIENATERDKELILIYIGYYIARFPDVLPENLADLNPDELNNREKDITRIAEAIEIKHEQFFTQNQQEEPLVRWEDLDDRLEALVYGHYSDSIKTLLKEYHSRLVELNKMQYLSYYLNNNPGIQHKAGVPIGGTFILVYHGDSPAGETNITPVKGNFVIRGQVVFQNNEPIPGAIILAKGLSNGTTTDFTGNFVFRTTQLPVTLRVSFTGFRSLEKLITAEGFYIFDLSIGAEENNQIIPQDFFNGEIIADFYLPYLCNSDCSPVQFILPVIPPSFTVETGCTDGEGNARVIVSPVGGTAPYKLKVNEGNFAEISETLILPPGEYKLIVKDAEGIDSAAQNITIAEALTLGQPNFDCTGDNNQYVAVIEIMGGTPPYSANMGRILTDKTFFGENLPGDTDIEVIITDSRNCIASAVINHSCGPELSFIARIGCTSSDAVSPVEILASGGKAPYEVQVDNQSFIPVGEPLQLSSGKHTLVVRDAAETLTPSLHIEIPGQLVISEPNFDCVGDNNEYVAVLSISGGQPPYTANRGNVMGNSYVSDPLPGNTDIEIVIKDARSCTTSFNVNHTCLADLSFSFNISCTSANGAAIVEIFPEGGAAPYEIQVGTTTFKPLTGPIGLPTGINLLTLRDANFNNTSQSITVPEALTLSIVQFSCDKENKTYQARIGINGGTPPYIGAGLPVIGNEFVTEPIPSGQSVSIQVFDDQKCTASLEVQHTCDNPCDLPCEGQSIECAYRLWLQPPSKTESYEVYQTLENVNFRFNGEVLQLRNADHLLQIPTAELNQSFDKAIEKAIKKLDKAIAVALLDALGDAGRNRLTVSYNPLETDPFAVLRIEHFVCDTFSIEFTYRYSKPNPEFILGVNYTNELNEAGVSFDRTEFVNHGLNNKQTIVPAFDCSERNLCTGSDFTKLCKDNNLTPEFDIGFFRTRVLLTSTTPGDNLTAWVWDISGTAAAEPFYEGEKVQIQVEKRTGIIRLTVISGKSCFAFTDKELKG